MYYFFHLTTFGASECTVFDASKAFDLIPPGVLDAFAQDIADRYNIKRYCLFSSPVHFLSVMFHLVHFNAEGRIPMKLEDDPFLIPNFPPIPPCDFPPSQHADIKTPNTHIFLRDESSWLWKSAGVLVNSVYELEAPAIEGLCQYLADASPNEVVLLILVAYQSFNGENRKLLLATKISQEENNLFHFAFYH